MLVLVVISTLSLANLILAGCCINDFNTCGDNLPAGCGVLDDIFPQSLYSCEEGKDPKKLRDCSVTCFQTKTNDICTSRPGRKS